MIALRNLTTSLRAQIVLSSLGLGMMNPNAHLIYVGSTHANAGTGKSGLDPNNPLSTVDEAIGQCTASRGDIIVVLPGHVETITAAAGVAMDVAGVTVLCLGSGSLRGQFNFTTAVGASIKVTAANCAIIGALCTGGIDALTNPLDIEAADFKFYGCETRDVTGQATDFIVTTAAADRLHIRDWFHNGAAAAGADTAISIVGGDHIVIEDFEIVGNFAVSAIENVTTAATNYRIGGGGRPCRFWNKNSADVCVTMVAGAAGAIMGPIDAMLTDNAANITEAFVATGGQFFQPIRIVNLAGESSMETNITASTDA